MSGTIADYGLATALFFTIQHRAQGGAAAPDPAAYGLSPPLFQPLTAYAAHGRIFPAPARGIPAPR
jgi:hypothetical protein